MKNLLVVLAFVVLTVVMTFPLITEATTAIAGPAGDGFIHLYEMFWFKRAIFDLHVWPLFNPEVFYPFGYSLALSHITPSNTLPMMPVVLLAGPIVGFNTAVFLSFILSGLGAYLLVVHFTGNRWAGLLSGVLFAFSPYRFHNLGAGWLPNLGTQWLPFAVLYLDGLLTERGSPVRCGALAGFFFALVCLSSWYHVYIAGLALAAFVLVRGRPWRKRLLSRRTICGLSCFALVAVVMILPLALPLIQYGATEKDVDWPLLSADDASASVDDLILPGAYHPLWSDWALARRHPSYAAIPPGVIYAGLPALLLALYAVRRRQTAADAILAIALVGAIMALGLTLHVNGQRVYVPVPAAVEDIFSRGMLTLAGKLAPNYGSYTPFRADNAIPVVLPGMFFWLFMPFGSTMRVFHRFGLASSLGFAVLAGLGAAALLARWGSRRSLAAQRILGAVLVVVALFDFAAAPLNVGFSTATGSELDLWLREQAGDFSVLHLPLVRGLNGPGLYRAAIHGKKISYGYGTFFPRAWREAAGSLGEFPNPEALALLRSWNVRYVLIGEGAYRAGLVDVPGDSWDKVQQRLAATPGLRFVRTFEEPSPVYGDTLSPRLTKPWPVVPVVADRTHVYEIES